MKMFAPPVLAHWATRTVTAAIFLMGALPKFTGGAEALAQRIPGGGAAVLAIGIAEIAAVILMFIPRLDMVGSGLASLLMLGAVASHVFGPVGIEGDFGVMLVMAVVALIAAVAATVLAWKRHVPTAPRPPSPSA